MYGYSGALILLSRSDNRVTAVSRQERKPLMQWPDTETWLNSELPRLSLLYNAEGRLLTDERFTEPWAGSNIGSM